MFALIDKDLVLGRTTNPQPHNVKVSEGVRLSDMRFDGSQLVDVSGYVDYQFYIDSEGYKHIVQHDEWQPLICGFNDALVNESDIWRVKSADDVYQEQRKAVDDKRQFEYTQRVRPYLEEADIKKHMGDQDEYTRLMDLAVQEREKIQTENPWPTPPIN